MGRKDKGKTICIFSGKGGVGKTFITINLAGIVANIKKKVLIIDLDLCNGGIALSLDKEPEKTIYNLVDDIANNRFQNFNDYVTQYNEYIDFLASPKDPRQATKIDPKYLDYLLDKCVYHYDLILIDTTHNLNELNLVTLDIVDEILFVLTNDPLDIKNMKSLISIFNDNEITNYKVLLNNSINTERTYFDIFDIKNILKANIDFVLSDRSHIKNIDDFILNGKILTLNQKASSYLVKDYTVFTNIIADYLIDSESGDKNE